MLRQQARKHLYRIASFMYIYCMYYDIVAMEDAMRDRRGSRSALK